MICHGIYICISSKSTYTTAPPYRPEHDKPDFLCKNQKCKTKKKNINIKIVFSSDLLATSKASLRSKSKVSITKLTVIANCWSTKESLPCLECVLQPVFPYRVRSV